MSGTFTFKCPSCGAYLEFDPGQQKFVCPYCLKKLTREELESLREDSAKGQPQPAPQSASQSMESPLRSYHCQSCGAEIVTSATTAATRCYYCHSPVVLSDRLDGDFRPDGVLPFKLTRDEAMRQFEAFIRRKHFVDRRFFSRDQLETFSGVYYPFWMGDLEGDASLSGEGTRVSVITSRRETVTTTRYFRVQRQGHLRFRAMMRKALSTCDRQLSDGIHPFKTEEIQPFEPGYLSGFLAEKRDVDKEGAQREMKDEASMYAEVMMKSNHTYNSLRGETSFQVTNTKMRYVLLPAWVLTYKSDKPGATYYYMMNGQTGQVCGKLPISMARLAAWAGGIGAAVAGLLCMGGALLW